MTTNFFDFHSTKLVFKIHPNDTNSIIPAFVGHMLRGVVLNLIKANDPDLSAVLHRSNEIRPYAVSNLYSLTHRRPERNKGKIILSPKDELAFNFKTVNLMVGKALLSSLLDLKNEQIQIADKTFNIDSITVSTKKYTDEVLLNSPVSDRIEIDFLTPTQFISIVTKNVFLFPDPRYFFGNLIQTAKSLNLLNVSIDYDSFMEFVSQKLYIRLYDLKTRIVKMGKLPLMVGFTGWVRYINTDPENDYANLLPFLLTIGEILNVGKKRTAGMGVIKTKFPIKSDHSAISEKYNE